MLSPVAVKRNRVTGFLLFALVCAASRAVAAPVTIELVPYGERSDVLGIGGGSNSALSASAKQTLYVFKELVLPRMETRAEAEQAAPAAGREGRYGRMPRTFGGMLRYESVRSDGSSGLDLDGSVYSTNLQASWRVNRSEFGVLVPYEFLDLRDVRAHRVGAIGFGRYEARPSADSALDLIVNGNYAHTAIEKGDLEDVNTFGGGAGLALRVNQRSFQWGLAFSYQFNADDSGTENDTQHLLRLGAEAGVPLGRNSIVSVFGIWSYDPTDYTGEVDVDRDYFEVGLDAAYHVSRSWGLHGGYKKVVDLRNFESDMIYLGTLLRF